MQQHQNPLGCDLGKCCLLLTACTSEFPNLNLFTTLIVESSLVQVTAATIVECAAGVE